MVLAFPNLVISCVLLWMSQVECSPWGLFFPDHVIHSVFVICSYHFYVLLTRWFCLFYIQLLICFCVFSTYLLVDFPLVILEGPVFYCLTLYRYLLDLLSFANIFWVISSRCVVRLVYGYLLGISSFRSGSCVLPTFVVLLVIAVSLVYPLFPSKLFISLPILLGDTYFITDAFCFCTD